MRPNRHVYTVLAEMITTPNSERYVSEVGAAIGVHDDTVRRAMRQWVAAGLLTERRVTEGTPRTLYRVAPERAEEIPAVLATRDGDVVRAMIERGRT